MLRSLANFKNAFRALAHRNYRLFFIGQGLSLIGTWMQNIALSWLVYRITNSVMLLGVVGFLGQIMIFLFGPFAGAIADRFDRRRIVIATQTLAMLQAFVLAVLVYTDTIAVWQIMVLSLFLGFILSFDAPTRQSFVVEMIDNKKDLSNAIALNSSIFNGARLIGPAVAGVMIASLGEGLCFLINGISYLCVIVSLLMMRIKPRHERPTAKKIFNEIREGFAYAYRFAPIRYIILLLGMISLLGMPYTVLMPVFARDVLHGGPQTLGFLMGAAGIGALGGALYMASRRNVVGLGGLIAFSSSVFSLGLLALAFSRAEWLALLVMAVIGFGMIMHMASSNTLLQTIVEEDKRGRVMSLYTMAFLGMTPFGSLIAGGIADRFGIRAALSGCGLACLLCVGGYMLVLPEIRKKVRPIYIKMGIVPEVATAIQTVSELTSVVEKE
ncbi:MAG TPA: MFS transporter [Candidatus Omnitrophota bacterium]|nr:MFS transporter [Candidatus Omnitrophota bacterium]